MTTTDPGIAGIGVPTVYRAEVRTSIWSGSVSGSVIWLRLNDGSDSANFPPDDDDDVTEFYSGIALDPQAAYELGKR